MNALWFTARGAGLSALLVLSISTTLGALGSRATARPDSRVVLQYVHRTAALVGLLLVTVHVTTLVLDRKAHVGVAGVFVPFASAYKPGAVTLGSIAAYLFVLVAALGLARGRLAATAAGARTWRGLHALSYAAWLSALLHGLNAGTDRGQPWVRWLALCCVVAVAGALVVRLFGLDGQRLATAPAVRARGAAR